MRLVLLGPPGAGKGTQALILAERLDVPAISTGDLFRAAVAHGSSVGAAVRRHMAEGRLVPDALTISLVADRVAEPDTEPGFVLDGFPRTLEQAHALDAMLARNDIRLDGVLALHLDTDQVVRRLAGRRTCGRCQAPWHTQFHPTRRPDRCDACGGELYQRDDDADAAIRMRLAVYARQTAPLLDYYAGSGQLVDIDAAGAVEEVAAAALTALDEHCVVAAIA